MCARRLLMNLLVLTFVVSLTLGCSLARLRLGDLAQYTTPLSFETIVDICEQFDLEDDRRCQPEQVVYAPDFFPDILASFERGISTREDLQAKLGQYEYDCDKPIYVPSLDNTYYWCSYDLNGDKVFPIGIRYDVIKNQDIVSGMVGTIIDD